MSYKLSIIIPVFNAGKDISNSIESIVNQTIGFENIELIIVDDYSTDNSRDIISSYAKKFDNIKKIFLEENSGGASKPRNTGLDNVTTDYVIFIDADDSIMKDYCETLYDLIIKEDADIVYCREASKFLDGVYAYSDISKDYSLVEDSLSLRLTVWGNIFRKKLIDVHNIRFPKYAEDGNFALRAYFYAKKIIQLPNYCGYIYY